MSVSLSCCLSRKRFCLKHYFLPTLMKWQCEPFFCWNRVQSLVQGVGGNWCSDLKRMARITMRLVKKERKILHTCSFVLAIWWWLGVWLWINLYIFKEAYNGLGTKSQKYYSRWPWMDKSLDRFLFAVVKRVLISVEVDHIPTWETKKNWN